MSEASVVSFFAAYITQRCELNTCMNELVSVIEMSQECKVRVYASIGVQGTDRDLYARLKAKLRYALKKRAKVTERSEETTAMTSEDGSVTVTLRHCILLPFEHYELILREAMPSFIVFFEAGQMLWDPHRIEWHTSCISTMHENSIKLPNAICSPWYTAPISSKDEPLTCDFKTVDWMLESHKFAIYTSRRSMNTCYLQYMVHTSTLKEFLEYVGRKHTLTEHTSTEETQFWKAIDSMESKDIGTVFVMFMRLMPHCKVYSMDYEEKCPWLYFDTRAPCR